MFVVAGATQKERYFPCSVLAYCFAQYLAFEGHYAVTPSVVCI